jgi:hypothetical protein
MLATMVGKVQQGRGHATKGIGGSRIPSDESITSQHSRHRQRRGECRRELDVLGLGCRFLVRNNFGLVVLSVAQSESPRKESESWLLLRSGRRISFLVAMIALSIVGDAKFVVTKLKEVGWLSIN